ncbi:MAG TPA: nicotinate phosphoribosyltransferase [Burkholderiaceae bacterium]|nr:nicotinate phosphoribosyltransferase [Burkholderiaceae bacterium]
MRSALLTDLYQLTMLQAYLDEGMDESAVFEMFVRKLPAGRNFLIAAGLEQALEFLETLSFSEEEIAWLEGQGGFSRRLLDYLHSFRFCGDVHAMPEGTVFFADEPILRITAPLPQAQFVESRLLNIVHFQTLIASKAARMVLAAPQKLLVDFGMRRAHGAEAAICAARAAYLAGFGGTATAEAGRLFGIPVFGTMAHSFIQAHASERAAFEAFARARPARPTLLVDTYNNEAAIEKVIELAPVLARDSIHIGGVRLDSGDLGAHAKAARALLDRALLNDITIFASGNLDESRIAGLLAEGAPIDGFGVGTSLDTSSDAPALDAVYKIQSYAGVARRKRSEGKATWPGIKQVFRMTNADGRMTGDTIALEGEAQQGRALLRAFMHNGQRTGPGPTLAQIREYTAQQLHALPEPLRGLDAPTQPYPVEISSRLRALTGEVDAATR